MTNVTISVAVPAYNRTQELRELLQSFIESDQLPEELLVVEDCSPERLSIRALVNQHVPVFSARGCPLRLIENERNLGYDGNVRAAIAHASSQWVMLLGNDDVIAHGGIAATRRFLSSYPAVAMASRTFFRFTNDPHRPIGVSRAHSGNATFSRRNAEPAVAFRLCGFVGGLIVDREWACANATDRYDGTLYYQMYLAFHAYSDRGIGYIDAPVVGGRAGNAPLFGSASSERKTHLPGSYQPKARAHMWASVLRIAEEVGAATACPLVNSIRRELDARQSFHVFEMMTSSPRFVLLELQRELRAIGLQRSIPATVFFCVNYLFGMRARFFYALARRVMQ